MLIFFLPILITDATQEVLVSSKSPSVKKKKKKKYINNKLFHVEEKGI